MIQAFIIFFALALLFNTFINNADKTYSKRVRTEFEKELAANFSRKRNIPDEIFCTPNLENLPMKDYPEGDESFIPVIAAQDKVLRKANLKMLKLSPPLSNIEIKKKFGYANLEIIIDCEENYYAYLHALNSLAASLIKINDLEHAEKILLYCILEMESNILKTYSLLFQIYMNTNKKDKLQDIFTRINEIESLQHEDTLKEKIKNQFNNIINNL